MYSNHGLNYFIESIKNCHIHTEVPKFSIMTSTESQNISEVRQRKLGPGGDADNPQDNDDNSANVFQPDAESDQVCNSYFV